MASFNCPFLAGSVELSEERERHIAERHPDLLPAHRDKLSATLSEPDEVRRSTRFGNARLFSRWYTEIRGGKHVIVVVVSDEGGDNRHWVITAYLSRRLVEGAVEWKRS